MISVAHSSPNRSLNNSDLHLPQPHCQQDSECSTLIIHVRSHTDQHSTISNTTTTASPLADIFNYLLVVYPPLSVNFNPGLTSWRIGLAPYSWQLIGHHQDDFASRLLTSNMPHLSFGPTRGTSEHSLIHRYVGASAKSGRGVLKSILIP